jgi:NADH-quinone oxidoreductase subunit C
MDYQKLFDQLRERFGDDARALVVEAIDPWIEVSAERLEDVCRLLKNDSAWQFNLLNCITAVDYFEPDAKKAAKVDWQPHVQMLYHLSSTTLKHSVVIKVRLPRWKSDVAGQLPEVASVSGIWRTADWHEREVFDLMGVMFVGHPDLRRILCPEDWEGYPLRKDYVMPLEYHGIRNR